MRKIKFRAWHIEDKKMIQNIQCVYDGPDEEDCFAGYIEQEGQYGRHGVKGKYHVMQFTGLKDKNGVEIFEGDTVKYKQAKLFDKEDYKECIQTVFYDSGAWTPIYLMYHQFHDFDDKPLQIFDVEVIGNIYENPAVIRLSDGD